MLKEKKSAARVSELSFFPPPIVCIRERHPRTGTHSTLFRKTIYPLGPSLAKHFQNFIDDTMI